MNGPHMFSVFTRRLSEREQAECHRVADLCKVEFIYVGRGGIPGSATTGWFETENRGEPFNSAASKHVAECLEHAGVWP